MATMKFLSFALILLSLTYYVQASLEDDLKRLEDGKLTESGAMDENC